MSFVGDYCTYLRTKISKNIFCIKFYSKISKKMSNIDDVFRDLEKAGKTDVENLIKWMKASKVVEVGKDEQVRTLFKEAKNQQKVELEKFKEIVGKLAKEQSNTLDQFSKQLAAEGPKIVDAAIKGLQAFKEALQTGIGK